LYYLQRIYNSLSKLSYLQRINIRCWIVCPATNLGFAAEVELSAANLKFAAEIELFAANVNSLSNSVFYSEIVSRCGGCIVCNEFVTRCRNWVVCSELAFTAEIVRQQRTSFRCQTVQPAANQFSLPIFTIGLPDINDSNACNNFIGWWCKMWNTWTLTYELLKLVWWRMWFKDTNVLICDHWCLRWCGRDRTIIMTRTTRRWSR
jgi:hypothetical protein